MSGIRRGPRVLSIALALVFAFSFAAYASQASAHTTSSRLLAPELAPQKNVLRDFVAWGDVWPKTLDPCCATDTLSNNALSLVNANLIKQSYPSLKIVGDLAQTWKVSKDHLFYTFHLHKNARFGNGDPVTAQDVVWSLTRALMPATKSPVALTYLGEIVGASDVSGGKSKVLKGIRALNKYTVQIHVRQPVAYFLGALSYPTADVLDPKVMRGQTASTFLTNKCSANVGAGPFVMVCQNNGTGKSSFYPSGHSPYIRYKPNPYYYGTKPHIQIVMPFFNTNSDVFHAYEAGELDGAPVPAADLANAKKMKGFTAHSALISDYITANQQIPPFNNINCRLAFAYAIDRVGITTKLLRNTEGPDYGVLPPGLQGYFKGSAGVPGYDVNKAKSYLANCPGKLQNITLTYQSTSPDLDHEENAIRAEIQAIGGNVTLKPLTFDSWLNVVAQNMNATKTQEQITENLWLDDYPDAQDWMSNLLQTGANYDIGGWSNKTFDDLVNKANVTFNPTQRANLYERASKLAVNQGAWISVGYGKSIFVVNPRVTGLVNNPDGFPFPQDADWSKVSVG